MKKLGLGSDVDWLTVSGLKVWEDVGREEVRVRVRCRLAHRQRPEGLGGCGT